MERRNFLKSSCNICLLGAAGFLLPQLTGCSGGTKYSVYKTAINNNAVQVPLNLFDTTPVQFVRPNGWYFDIAVEKKADNTYRALLLQCTHQENQLNITGNGYSCSLHGSQFDKEGNVRKGPAEKSLEQYATFIDNNNLIIKVPQTP
jgi:Rieske Fe-S protein